MNRIPSTINRRLVLLALALCAAAACDGITPDPSASPSGEAASDDHPTPAYSLKMDNGNQVDFYDLGDNALVTETGRADKANTSMLPGASAMANGNLADLFRALQPGTEVPAAISALAQKVADAKATAAPVSDLTVVETDSKGGGGPGTPAATQQGDDTVRQDTLLLGCSNGCCDPDWTQSYLCSGSFSGLASYNWYLFNYGYSSVALNSKTYAFEGTVCSAIGDSSYKVALSGGGGGTWSVHEGNFLTYHYYNHSGKAANLYANSSGNQHLHTFCGWKLQ